MRTSRTDLIGLMHSFGYVRGLLSSLSFPERRRVTSLACAACRAIHTARHAGRRGDLYLVISLLYTRMQVSLQP